MWNTEFLIACVLVLPAGLGATAAARRRRPAPEPDSAAGQDLALLDAAFLAGGPARVADTVIVRMQQEGRLIISRDQLVTVTDGQPGDRTEAALIEAVGPSRRGELHSLRQEVMRSEPVQAIGDRLAKQGLMRHPAGRPGAVRARRLLWLALLITLALGVVATLLWADRPRPERDAGAPPFFAFFGLLLLGGFWLAATKPDNARVTPAGARRLARMREGSGPWLPAGLVGAGAALLLGAVALEGVQALEDEELRAALQASSLGRVLSGGSLSGGSGTGGSVSWCATSWVGGRSDPFGSSGGGCGSSHSGCGSSHGSHGSHSSCGSSPSGCGSSCGSSCGSGCGSGCGGGS